MTRHDDGGASDTATGRRRRRTTASGGGGETVEISETEFALDPADPTVAAGSVTFDVSNDGETVHNLEIEGNGVEEVTDTIEAGASAQLTVDLEPASYEMYCAIGDHARPGHGGHAHGRRSRSKPAQRRRGSASPSAPRSLPGGTQPPKRALELERDRDRDVVAVAAGGDLDAERQAGVVEAQRHLGDRQAEQVEERRRRDHPRPPDGAPVARRDPRERRVQEDAVADRLGDLLGEIPLGGERAALEPLRAGTARVLGGERHQQRRRVAGCGRGPRRATRRPKPGSWAPPSVSSSRSPPDSRIAFRYGWITRLDGRQRDRTTSAPASRSARAARIRALRSSSETGSSRGVVGDHHPQALDRDLRRVAELDLAHGLVDPVGPGDGAQERHQVLGAAGQRAAAEQREPRSFGNG